MAVSSHEVGVAQVSVPVVTDAGAAEEPPSCYLLGLLPKALHANQTLVGRFRHDLDTGKLQLKPLSIVTGDSVVRLTL